jgi:hypothetical protein
MSSVQQVHHAQPLHAAAACAFSHAPGQGELIRAHPALALPHLALHHAPRAAMWVFSLCTGLSTSLMYSIAPLSLHLLGQSSPRVSAPLPLF